MTYKKNNSHRWKIAQEYERMWCNLRWKPEIENKDKIIKKYWWFHLHNVKDNVNIDCNTNILEIGCGATSLICNINEGKLFALDPLMNYYISNFQMNDNINNMVGMGENLPFRNELFQIVILTNVLDHVMNPISLLNEVNRVLSKDGVLYLTVNCHNFILIKYNESKEFIGKGDKPHPFSFSFKEINRLIRKTKFDIINASEGIGDVGKYIQRYKEINGVKITTRSMQTNPINESWKKNDKKDFFRLIDRMILKTYHSINKKLPRVLSQKDYIFICRKK